MKLSAKNQLKGEVVSITEGPVNGVVVIDIGGGNQISSTIRRRNPLPRASRAEPGE